MGRCPIPRPRRRGAQGQGEKSIPPATERSVFFVEPIKGAASPVVAAPVRQPEAPPYLPTPPEGRQA